jgi:phosphatidate cytidylyltransferase
MAGDDEERGGKFEDLFDDLDKFFTPAERTERARAREEAEAASQEAGAQAKPQEPELPDADLLPEGWQPDVEDMDVTILPDPPETSEPEEPSSAEDPVVIVPPEDAEPAAEADEARSAWAPEPTGEMSGEDWTRLRDVMGEGESEDDEEFEFLTGAGEGPHDESLFHLASDQAEDASSPPEWFEAEAPDELSIEDLKKAPPEYKDLPVADAGAPEPGGPDSPDEPAWEEPAISEVEAAADQLAHEFRDAPEDVESELLADLDQPMGPRTIKVGEPEGMSGPTWEEPTSRVVSNEKTIPLIGGRNLPAAILTAVGLAAVALLALAWRPAAFAVVAGVVVLLGQFELYATMQRRGYHPAGALGLVMGAMVLAGAYLKGEQAMAYLIALSLAMTFLWYMVAAPKAREGALANIGATLVGIVYVPMLAGYLLIVLTQPNSGRSLMLAILGLTFLYDVMAFVIGSFWGSRPLAPTISPKKSWEGLFGATAVTFIVAFAFLPSIHPLTPLKSVGLWIVVSVFAPLGDLAESLIKRDLGVKDMGSILPGHGGALDRIDSVLFVAPAAFYFLRLIF